MTETTDDRGVDIFASHDSERLAVQVKMHAGSRVTRMPHPQASTDRFR